MPHHAVDERHALAETLRRVGPDAPTLCGDWRSRHLTAHLVLRERSLTELAGRAPVARWHERAERQIERVAVQRPYDELVGALDAGPPRWSPLALPPLRELVNLVEYLVHHEDVRRAGDDWQPRPLPADLQTTLWRRLRLVGPVTLRAVTGRVELVWPGHGEIASRRRGEPVRVSGDPVELTLLSFGRQRVAQVAYDGPPERVSALRTARIAL